jgi:hypothetical protein
MATRIRNGFNDRMMHGKAKPSHDKPIRSSRNWFSNYSGYGYNVMSGGGHICTDVGDTGPGDMCYDEIADEEHWA